MAQEVDRIPLRMACAVAIILLCCFVAKVGEHRATVVELEAARVTQDEAASTIELLEEELTDLERQLAELREQVARLEELEAALRARVPGLVPGPRSDARIASVARAEDLAGRLELLVAEVDRLPTSWPVAGGRITSGWGLRQDPMGGPDEGFHFGLDIAARRGTPVLAAGPGRVIFAGWLGACGNTVILDHGHGVQSLYAHLDKIRARHGDFVGRGWSVGTVGSTGRSTGPHLHFEIRVGGERVDSWPWVQQGGR